MTGIEVLIERWILLGLVLILTCDGSMIPNLANSFRRIKTSVDVRQGTWMWYSGNFRVAKATLYSGLDPRDRAW